MTSRADEALKWAGVAMILAYTVFLLVSIGGVLASYPWDSERWAAAGSWAQAMFAGVAMVVVALGYVHQRAEAARLQREAEPVFSRSTVQVNIEDVVGTFYYIYRIQSMNTGGQATHIRCVIGNTVAAHPRSGSPGAYRAAAKRQIVPILGPNRKGPVLALYGEPYPNGSENSILRDDEREVVITCMNYWGQARRYRYLMDRGPIEFSGSVFTLVPALDIPPEQRQ